MRLRPDVTLGLGGLLLLVLLAVVLGSPSQSSERNLDRRRSTYLYGPFGARAIADALERLGISVERERSRIPSLPPSTPSDQVLYVVLDPARPVSLREAAAIMAATERGSELFVTGVSANALLRCFGYVAQSRPDSTPAHQPGVPVPTGGLWVSAVLGRTGAAEVTETDDRADVGGARCQVPTPEEVDTILVARGGRLAAVRLRYPDRPAVTLLSDGGLLSNRHVRETDAGIFVLELWAGYARVVFDEYHHGFGRRGSLAGATLRWSWTSPGGWAVWQMAIVGTLALLASGIRFGAPERGIQRRRRSGLEHVRALATALAAAHGHRVAVRLILRGLERRLSRTRSGRLTPPEEWLAALAPTLRTPTGRAALERLRAIASGPEPGPGTVVMAAHAVEDLWQDLRP